MKAVTPSAEMAQQLVTKVVDWGVDGVGFMTGAAAVADEHLRTAGDPEKAIRRLVATHRRIVAASGFATGIGGVWTMPIAVPTDLTVATTSTPTRCGAWC